MVVTHKNRLRAFDFIVHSLHLIVFFGVEKKQNKAGHGLSFLFGSNVSVFLLCMKCWLLGVGGEEMVVGL